MSRDSFNKEFDGSKSVLFFKHFESIISIFGKNTKEMTKETSGYLVKYTDKSGLVQKGIVRYSDQLPQFQKLNKVYVWLVDDNFHFLKDENQKAKGTLKHVDTLTKIGFTD